MTENRNDESNAEENEVAAEQGPDTEQAGDKDADEIEKELLDAMKKLRGANRKIEEYLDGIARVAENPPQEETDKPADA